MKAETEQAKKKAMADLTGNVTKQPLGAPGGMNIPSPSFMPQETPPLPPAENMTMGASPSLLKPPTLPPPVNRPPNMAEIQARMPELLKFLSPEQALAALSKTGGVPDPFTLSPGQTRFDAQGRPIANIPETSAESKLTGNAFDVDFLRKAGKSDEDIIKTLYPDKKTNVSYSGDVKEYMDTHNNQIPTEKELLNYKAKMASAVRAPKANVNATFKSFAEAQQYIADNQPGMMSYYPVQNANGTWKINPPFVAQYGVSGLQVGGPPPGATGQPPVAKPILKDKYTVGQTVKKNGLTYKYIGNNQWQKI